MTNKAEASGVLVQPQNVLRKACMPRTTAAVPTPAMFLGKPRGSPIHLASDVFSNEGGGGAHCCCHPVAETYFRQFTTDPF